MFVGCYLNHASLSRFIGTNIVVINVGNTNLFFSFCRLLLKCKMGLWTFACLSKTLLLSKHVIIKIMLKFVLKLKKRRFIYGSILDSKINLILKKLGPFHKLCFDEE